MRTICIHQPNFIPWLGYFYKIANSDIFVVLDDVQYTKNSFINRNRIKTPQGPQWVTVPVKKAGNFGQMINETYISNRPKSLEKIVKTVEQNYKKANHFDRYFATFAQYLLQAPESISGLNSQLIRWIMEVVNIKTQVAFSSEIPTHNLTGTARLVAICKELEADRYFSGFGGMNYQEENQFNKANIAVQVSDFDHPVYNQLWGDFESNLSIMDLLFNCGPESKSVLLGNR